MIAYKTRELRRCSWCGNNIFKILSENPILDSYFFNNINEVDGYISAV